MESLADYRQGRIRSVPHSVLVLLEVEDLTRRAGRRHLTMQREAKLLVVVI